MDKIQFWIIAYKDISNIPKMLEKLKDITSFPFEVHILDNTDISTEPFEQLTTMKEEFPTCNITLYRTGENMFWSKGMNYLDATTPFCPYVIYLCSKHIIIYDVNGFDDMLKPLIENPNVAQTGRKARCAGLYYFKSINAPYPPQPNQPLYGFPHFLPKLEGKFSRLQIFDKGRIFLHIQGGLFAFNRQILRDVTGYDETLKHYFSDLEMGVRLQCYGYDLVDVPTIFSAVTNIEPMPNKEYKIVHCYADQKRESEIKQEETKKNEIT